MTADAALVAAQVDALVARLASQQEDGATLSDKEALVLRLSTQYPRDVGILSVYFLNLVVLQPGEAVYMAANEPHAYLAGAWLLTGNGSSQTRTRTKSKKAQHYVAALRDNIICAGTDMLRRNYLTYVDEQAGGKSMSCVPHLRAQVSARR